MATNHQDISDSFALYNISSIRRKGMITDQHTINFTCEVPDINSIVDCIKSSISSAKEKYTSKLSSVQLDDIFKCNFKVNRLHSKDPSTVNPYGYMFFTNPKTKQAIVDKVIVTIEKSYNWQDVPDVTDWTEESDLDTIHISIPLLPITYNGTVYNIRCRNSGAYIPDGKSHHLLTVTGMPKTVTSEQVQTLFQPYSTSSSFPVVLKIKSGPFLVRFNPSSYDALFAQQMMAKFTYEDSNVWTVFATKE